MISKLSDEAALDLLMTSEFEENYSPAEMKEMLLRYRYFYRILYSRFERMKEDRDFDLNRMLERIKLLENQFVGSQSECARMKDEINSLMFRKLTWKERIFGKIILTDENKGI